eukprot:1192945-Ditylum_brightwellii.AAC.1
MSVSGMNGENSTAKDGRKECKKQEAGSIVIKLSLTLFFYAAHEKRNEKYNKKIHVFALFVAYVG